MPATLVDYEQLSKGQHGQKYLLTLEALRKSVFHVGFALFYLLVLLFIIEIGFGYEVRWECYTLCGDSISVFPEHLDIQSLPETCRSNETGIIEALLEDVGLEDINISASNITNASVLCEFCTYLGLIAGRIGVAAHGWNGSFIHLQPLNRYYRAMVVFENPAPEANATVETLEVVAETWYAFGEASVIQNLTDRDLDVSPWTRSKAFLRWSLTPRLHPTSECVQTSCFRGFVRLGGLLC